MSGGLHGVGASVVNALSARLDCHVERGGQVHSMSFRRGEPGVFADQDPQPSPDAVFTPFVDGSQLLVTGKAKRGVTGSRVRYWADRQIFLHEVRRLTGTGHELVVGEGRLAQKDLPVGPVPHP